MKSQISNLKSAAVFVLLLAAAILPGCVGPDASSGALPGDPAVLRATGGVRLSDLASHNDPPIIPTAVPSAPLLTTELPPVERTGRTVHAAPAPRVSPATSPPLGPPGSPATPATPAPAPAAPLLVPAVAQTMVIPADDPRLGLAMTMLDDLGLEPALQHVWHQNGFRVGRIDRSRLPLLLANLPKAMDVTIVKVQPAPRWVPVTLINRLRGAMRVQSIDLTGHAHGHRLIGGELEVLLKLTPALDGSGKMQLEVLPHHHSDLPVLLPQTPDQRLLNGTRFDDLQITRTLDPDHIWVFTARLPAPPGSAPDEDAKPAPVGPKLPLLGPTMFTGKRGSRKVQVLLFIGLQK